MKIKKLSITLAAILVVFATMLCIYSTKLQNRNTAVFKITSGNYCEQENSDSDCSDCDFDSGFNVKPGHERNVMPRIGKRPDHRIPEVPDTDSECN